MITLAIWEVQKRHSGHWFSPGAMSFFKSRLSAEAYAKREGADAYFVSSERHGDNPRLYSVRKMNWATGNITTVGIGFQSYGNLRAAKKAAMEFAASDA